MPIMDELRKIPPVTRFLCISTLGVSVLCICRLISPYKLYFMKDRFLANFEVCSDGLVDEPVSDLLVDMETDNFFLHCRWVDVSHPNERCSEQFQVLDCSCYLTWLCYSTHCHYKPGGGFLKS